MSRPVPRSLHRIAAIALLLASIGAVGAAVAIPVAAINRTYDDSIESLRFQYEKLQRLAAIKAPLQIQLARLRSQAPRASDLLEGKSEALAGAQLQEIVKRYIRRAGGTLESTQMLPTSKNQFFERITVRVQLTASISALLRTLHAIESNRPLLMVDYFEIKNRQARQRVNRDPSRPVLLTVNFNMSGYRRSEAM